MQICKKNWLPFAAKLWIAASVLLIFSACSTINARVPAQPVCKVNLPEAALMQSRPNGALTISLNRLEAALAQRIEAQSITAGELINIWQAAATRLAELGDDSNATAIALQDHASKAAKRCSEAAP